MDLCSSSSNHSPDFVEWTTVNLTNGTYEINGLAACASWGTCAGSCEAYLYIDGNYKTTFIFTDTNTSDGNVYTPSTYSYNASSLSGVHTAKLVFTNDCFAESSGDRNFILHDINFVKSS